MLNFKTVENDIESTKNELSILRHKVENLKISENGSYNTNITEPQEIEPIVITSSHDFTDIQYAYFLPVSKAKISLITNNNSSILLYYERYKTESIVAISFNGVLLENDIDSNKFIQIFDNTVIYSDTVIYKPLQGGNFNLKIDSTGAYLYSTMHVKSGQMFNGSFTTFSSADDKIYCVNDMNAKLNYIINELNSFSRSYTQVDMKPFQYTTIGINELVTTIKNKIFGIISDNVLIDTAYTVIDDTGNVEPNPLVIDPTREINLRFNSIQFQSEDENGMDLSGLFEGWKFLYSVDFTNVQLSNVSDMSSLLLDCTNLHSVTFNSIPKSSKAITNLFTNCLALQTITLPVGFAKKLRNDSGLSLNSSLSSKINPLSDTTIITLKSYIDFTVIVRDR